MYRILILMICLAPAALPQEKKLSCDDNSHWRDRGHYCEMREVTMAASRLDVDGGANGGVSIKGDNRNDILVRSRVEAYQDDENASRQMATQIHVETSGGRIRATGPSEEHNHGWGVSYEILVPQRTDMVLHTKNGGISIRGVEGQIEFEAVNGGVSLVRLAGTVQGHTTNGGLHLELANDRWQGDRCDVSTTNGGVTIKVPAQYSAHLETGTVNGGVKVGFPVTVQGEINRRLAVDLGSGGNLVRATTTNGGVTVERSSAM